MKRIIAFFLLTIMIFSMVSCKKEENSTSSVTGTETENLEEISDEEALTRYIELIKTDEAKKSAKYQYDDLSQFINVANYIGVEFPYNYDIDCEIGDDELNEFFDYTMWEDFADKDSAETLSSGKVKPLDSLTIDFQGFIDGETSDEMTGNDYELVIGSKSFIDGFESGLIGKEIGSKVTLNLQFSPYYGSADVAGKKVVFNVTIKSAKRYALPEVTIEMINESYQSNFESIDAVKEAMRQSLSAQKEQNRFSSVVSFLLNKISDQSEMIYYPKTELEKYLNTYREYYETYAAQYEVSMSDFISQYLEMTEEEFQKSQEEYGKSTVKKDLILRTVAKAEGIEVTDEELREFITTNYENAEYFHSMSEFIEYYVVSQGEYYFADNALNAKAYDFIYQHAKEVK